MGVVTLYAPIEMLVSVSVPDDAEMSEGNTFVEVSCERIKLMLLTVTSLPSTTKTLDPCVSGETSFETVTVEEDGAIVTVPTANDVAMISAS